MCQDKLDQCRELLRRLQGAAGGPALGGDVTDLSCQDICDVARTVLQTNPAEEVRSLADEVIRECCGC